jgi:hypothetical protein
VDILGTLPLGTLNRVSLSTGRDVIGGVAAGFVAIRGTLLVGPLTGMSMP